MCVNSLRAVEIPPIKDEYLSEDIRVTKRDAYIVSSWINEMGKGIDDVIYSKDEAACKSLSQEEYCKFVSIIKS